MTFSSTNVCYIKRDDNWGLIAVISIYKESNDKQKWLIFYQKTRRLNIIFLLCTSISPEWRFKPGFHDYRDDKLIMRKNVFNSSKHSSHMNVFQCPNHQFLFLAIDVMHFGSDNWIQWLEISIEALLQLHSLCFIVLSFWIIMINSKLINNAFQ